MKIRSSALTGGSILLTIAMVATLFLGRLARALQTSSPSTLLYPRTWAFSGAKRLTTGSQLLSSLEEDSSGRRIRRKFDDDKDNNDNEWTPKPRGTEGARGRDDGKGDDDWRAPTSSRKTSSGRNDYRNNDSRGDNDWGAPTSSRKTSSERNEYRNNDSRGDNDWGAPTSTRKTSSERNDYRNNDSRGDDDWGAPMSTRDASSGRNDNLNDDSRGNDDWGASTSSRKASSGRNDYSNNDSRGNDDWGARTSSRKASSGRNDYRNNDRRGNNDWGAPTSSRNASSGRNDYGNNDRRGWDANYTPKPRSSRQGGEAAERGGWRGGGEKPRNFKDSRRNAPSDFYPRGIGGGRGRQSGQYQDTKDVGSRPINVNNLEAEGFVHLYGLSSVLNALQANRRDLTTVKERSAKFGDDDGDDENSFADREPPKPQAQFRPYLFVQERKSSGRRGQKATDAERVLSLAEERGVPVEEVDKGVLNTLSGNRPHQGFVLRCGGLYFESMSRIPIPSDGEEKTPSCWLVLDEVVDPQNLGALLRSAYFLGQGKLGIMVCSKNSAPPTPVVSAASAGALEIVTIYSTNNLPRTLNQAKDDGFRIIGASSSVPSHTDSMELDESEDPPPALYDLPDLPVSLEEDNRPVLLVLGSEGFGLRTLVSMACTEFVRIPSGFSDDSEGGKGVDSLNVSVTGGILLWQILSGRMKRHPSSQD